MIIQKRITIIKITKPVEPTFNDVLQWFGDSLGLFHLRDKDKSCFRIFIELLKVAREGLGLSSDEIAERTSLTRGTVVHHLNKLMESGLIMQQRNKYYLRDPSLESLLDHLKKDFEQTFEDLRNSARQIDNVLRLRN
ncbi:winged helix-turn-helix transcriptional regulator [Candidatus Woesearchaeota archaeon]|nr:winged helix-turn-helix transcriptional regulator [Candidatus Woesearchaeota archaeon]